MNIVEYLLTVDTATAANAVELCHVRPNEAGFTPLSIRCLFPELGRMAGYAVTAHVETITRQEKGRPDTFLELYELVASTPGPTVIALQEIGGHGEYAAHAGEVMSTIFQRLGAVGLVSDCAVRDIPEVRALGFHYFARGSVSSHANYRIARAGVPVQIGGVVIHTGDLLHGDENGLLSIPAECCADLPEKVDAIRSRERRLLEYVRSKDFTLAGLKGMMVE